MRPDHQACSNGWPWPDAPGPLAFEAHHVCDPMLPIDRPIDVPDALMRAQPRRRAEYQAGRVAAGRAVAQVIGRIEPPRMGPHRAPLWPDGVVGSISHSNGQAVAIAGSTDQYRGLGVDLEQVLGDRDATLIAPQVLRPAEQRAGPNLLRLTTIFSAKESLFKALYPIVQRMFWFHDAAVVTLNDDGTGSLRLCRGLGPEWPHGQGIQFRHCRYGDAVLTRIEINRTAGGDA